MTQTQWIWYPGDFEIYQGMKQNFDREERGFFWPAYWYTPGWNHNVVFSKTYQITAPTHFTVQGHGRGNVVINLPVAGKTDPQQIKHPFNTDIVCPVGDVKIEVIVGNLSGLPSAFIQGDVIHSDASWLATNYLGDPLPVGANKYFTRADQNPMTFEYSHRMLQPLATKVVNGGTLLDFGHDYTAVTQVAFKQGFKPLTICYGESETEALDVEMTYMKQTLDQGQSDFGSYQAGTYRTKLRAFRYLFVPGEPNLDQVATITADYQYVDFPVISHFKSSDQELDKIWQISDRTLRLCSGLFIIDGAKRDRWIWAGDAYQSYYMNQYDFFDKGLVERTMLALRGNLDIKQHLDTIIDYSMYWIIGVEQYYQTFADKTFLKAIYPKVESLMRYCMAQTNDLGFIYGRKGDWVYVDWADIDYDGTVSAEQMLLARSYQAMSHIQSILGIESTEFESKFTDLKRNIWQYFWDTEKGAFVDSYESGKRHVTRHANIFAVLFDYTTTAETKQIINNVLLNDEITAINTPYFKFWELEVFAKLGMFDNLKAQIKSYWGGMLQHGATTFWEYFDPNETKPAEYAMYGDKFGKSLCHAWGSSPLYLLGRYVMGLKPTKPGYAAFEVAPHTDWFTDLDCTLPIADGTINITISDGTLTVQATQAGGTLAYAGQQLALPANQPVSVPVKA